MKTLALACLMPLAALAAPIDDYLAANPGLADIRAIQAGLVAPTITLVTNEVDRAQATEEAKVRDAVVPELLTGKEWRDLRDAQREREVKLRLEARILAATNTAQRASALWLERSISLQAELIERDGGEPWGVDAGAKKRKVVNRIPGPSWWETNAPGQPLPTRDEIRAALRARTAATPPAPR